MTRYHCIILAGGSGSRIGGIPKQFRLLAGVPLLLHSLRAFAAWHRTTSLTVVSSAELMPETQRIVRDDCARPVRFAPGGATRHQSQLAGLNAVADETDSDDVIMIHDAARPFIQESELEELARAFEAPDVRIASLVVPASETIVRGSLAGDMSAVLDRSDLFMVKTPQALRGEALPALLACAEEPSFTDLLTWGAAAGLKCLLCAGAVYNMKITVEADLAAAEALCARLAER